MHQFTFQNLPLPVSETQSLSLSLRILKILKSEIKMARMEVNEKQEFNYTLKQREDQIRAILKSDSLENEVSVEDIRKRWASYLEQNLPPCPWVAKVKPKAIVDVLSIDWLNFKADCETLNEEESSESCCSHFLFQLFPLSVDDGESNKNSKAAAVALDHFRFFIDKLWFPWDDDDDNFEDHDWINDHLTKRVILFLIVSFTNNVTNPHLVSVFATRR